MGLHANSSRRISGAGSLKPTQQNKPTELMTKYSNRLAGWTTALLALTAASYADVKLNDNVTLSGYAVGAYMNYKASGATSVDSLFDASKPVPGGGDSNDVLTKFSL